MVHCVVDNNDRMRSHTYAAISLTVWLTGSLCSAVALAEPAAGSLGFVTQISSDWLYHGTTETLGEPVLGINAEWQSNGATFAGIEAHQARMPAEPQRQRSVMAYLGTGFALSESWFTTLSVQHREFPGSVKEWDFTEVSIDLAHRSGFGLRMDYAPDYYEHDIRAFAAEVRLSRPITPRSYWYAEVGALELSNEQSFDDHQYAQLGVGTSVSSLNLDLAYVWNSQGRDNTFGRERYSPAKLVLQVAYRLR